MRSILEAEQKQYPSLNDIKLNPSIPLFESASSIVWLPDPTLSVFACTFWDRKIKILQVCKYSIQQMLQIQLDTIPLTICWSLNNQHLFIGCVDGSIYCLNVNNSQINQITKHYNVITKVYFSKELNLLFSTSYQHFIYFWTFNQKQPVGKLNAEGKVLVSDFKKSILIGATSNQCIFIFDLSKTIDSKITKIDQILGKGSQIQSIAINKQADSVAFGSVDGRINISNIKKSQSQDKFLLTTYATIKIHWVIQNDLTILCPVNSVCFIQTRKELFLSAGSDGRLVIWGNYSDNYFKTKFNYVNPICCAAVSPTNKMIAYSTGNDWHIGPDGIGKWQNKIGVHIISQNETRPPNKQRQNRH